MRDHRDDGDFADGCASALLILGIVVAVCVMLARMFGWL